MPMIAASRVFRIETTVTSKASLGVPAGMPPVGVRVSASGLLAQVCAPCHRPILWLIERVGAQLVNGLIVWRRSDQLGIRIRFIGDLPDNGYPVIYIFQ
jgi:hypothetical protein